MLLCWRHPIVRSTLRQCLSTRGESKSGVRRSSRSPNLSVSETCSLNWFTSHFQVQKSSTPKSQRPPNQAVPTVNLTSNGWLKPVPQVIDAERPRRIRLHPPALAKLHAVLTKKTPSSVTRAQKTPRLACGEKEARMFPDASAQENNETKSVLPSRKSAILLTEDQVQRHT